MRQHFFALGKHLMRNNGLLSGFRTNHNTIQLLFAAIAIFLVICGGQAIAAAKNADVATFAQPADNHEYVADEILVILADDANVTSEDIGKMVGGVVKKHLTFTPSRKTKHPFQPINNPKQILRVKLPKDKSVKQAVAELKTKKDPRIVRVEPNYRVKSLGVPNDPYFTLLWAMRNTGQNGGTPNADIDATSAWNITTGSDNVVVAVIDTGIDYRHPDIAANIWTNSDETADNGSDDDHNGYIDDVHGYNFV